MDSLDKLQLLHNLRKKKDFGGVSWEELANISFDDPIYKVLHNRKETKKNFIALLTLKEPVMFFRCNLILQKRKDFTDLKWGYFVVIFYFFYWFCFEQPHILQS